MSQSVDANGQLLNTVQYTFNNADNQLTTIELAATGITQAFQTTYVAGQLSQASDGRTVLTCTPGSQAGRPARVVVSRAGVEQAAYAFSYGANGRLSSLRENRTVLPPDWFVPIRAYTFGYDATGNLTQEEVANTLSDGVIVTQVTTYTASTTPAPLVDVAEPALLTALALYQRHDALVARFWQTNNPVRYETQSKSMSGAGVVAARAQFTPTLNSEQRVASQRILVSTYPAGPQFPQDRALQQTFSYQCR